MVKAPQTSPIPQSSGRIFCRKFLKSGLQCGFSHISAADDSPEAVMGQGTERKSYRIVMPRMFQICVVAWVDPCGNPPTPDHG